MPIVRRVAVVLLSCLLFWYASAALADKEETPLGGFKAMAFGADYREVKAYLERTFPGLPLAAPTPAVLLLRQFDMGKLKADVQFSFDHAGRFMGFTMFTAKKGRHLEEEIAADHRLLKEAFAAKYGPRASCLESINLFDGVQCVWKDRSLNIATGYKEETSGGYRAFGLVESKKLVQEEEQLRKKEFEKKGPAASPF
jgi:hypothetical protein